MNMLLHDQIKPFQFLKVKYLLSLQLGHFLCSPIVHRPLLEFLVYVVVGFMCHLWAFLDAMLFNSKCLTFSIFPSA